MMSLDTRTLEGFDLAALQKELEGRHAQIDELKKAYDWAIKEHEDQITQLELAIEWKRQHDNKNRSRG